MENIARFTQAARAFGLSDSESFQTVDLYEKMNLHQVILCLFALGRKVHAHTRIIFFLLHSSYSFRHKNKDYVVLVQKKAIETNEISPNKPSIKEIASSVLNMVITKEPHNRE